VTEWVFSRLPSPKGELWKFGGIETGQLPQSRKPLDPLTPFGKLLLLLPTAAGCALPLGFFLTVDQTTSLPPLGLLFLGNAAASTWF
jgi:hypothetical protein